MSYLVQASPLTKIFLKEWHDKCLADPKLIAEVSPFTVHIPRPSGAIELKHNVPVLANTLIPTVKERKVQEDEISPLVAWLTHEQNPETDIYGVVAIPIETNVADAIMSLIHDKGSEAATLKMINSLKKNLAENIKSARERADARVLRQCNKMYDIVRTTLGLMKKDGKGVYSPSYSEALALDILKDSIKLRRAPDDRASKIMESAMADMSGVPV